MSDSALASGQLPIWIKLLYTLFVCALIPIYWAKYGPANFLWFSDIALLTLVAALWLENSFLASMMALAVLGPEIAWNLDFIGRLMIGGKTGGLSGYMFNSGIPLYLRLLSLFHVVLPVLLVWLMVWLRYDRRALVAQILVALVVLPVSYLVSPASANINWVYGFGGQQQRLPPVAYLGVLMVLFPLVLYLPTHWVLLRFFGRP